MNSKLKLVHNFKYLSPVIIVGKSDISERILILLSETVHFFYFLNATGTKFLCIMKKGFNQVIPFICLLLLQALNCRCMQV
jgi:hypothetical protein